jgi:membrane protease YdiL (CAAX protease family)
MKSSAEHNQQTSASKNLKALMLRHPLLSFFILAYAISWILTIPFILSEWGVLQGHFEFIFAIKSFGPFLAAYLMTRIIEGKEGVVRLRQRIKQKRAGWMWYLFILAGIPALIILGITLQPGRLDGFLGLTPLLLVSYPLTFIAVFFGGGPLGEEPGWRGFALPRLQKRFGPLWGTLLLSVLWTCWHLPDFLTSAQGAAPGNVIPNFLTNFPLFFLLVTAIGVILTWIYNRTEESIFLVILAHASVNTPQVSLVPLFPAVDTASLNLAALFGFGVTALLILIFTCGRLGYQPDEA